MHRFLALLAGPIIGAGVVALVYVEFILPTLEAAGAAMGAR